MNTIHQDDDYMIGVHDNNTVWLAIEDGNLIVSRVLDPDEAVDIGRALVAAGTKADAQCCADGCGNPATEFPDSADFVGGVV